MHTETVHNKTHISPIHNEHDYEKALERIEKLMDAAPDTPEFDELDILTTLVEVYEDKTFPIDAPDPIEAIRFCMDQMGYTRQDLQEKMHYTRNRISEILNRKRPLSIKMIRDFHIHLHVPATILIKEYELDR